MQYLGLPSRSTIRPERRLKEAELDHTADVTVTGIGAPREARLILPADPAETPDYAALPQRIRTPLRDFLITLDVPEGEHGKLTQNLIGELLLNGEPIRLVRMEPRT